LAVRPSFCQSAGSKNKRRGRTLHADCALSLTEGCGEVKANGQDKRRGAERFPLQAIRVSQAPLNGVTLDVRTRQKRCLPEEAAYQADWAL